LHLLALIPNQRAFQRNELRGISLSVRVNA
jgi:hypothetical protein